MLLLLISNIVELSEIVSDNTKKRNQKRMTKYHVDNEEVINEKRRIHYNLNYENITKKVNE